MNRKIKFREPFRPFAPSVLVEHTEAFFDLPDAERHYPARFMLYVVDVKAHQRDRVPAITHVDGTARLQTVHRRWSPRYHRLISAFKAATGYPVLVNTSFNVRGEPIVCTPEDAFRCLMGTGIELLVVGNCILRQEDQDATLCKDDSNTYERD